jgi:hypothetical protein
VQVTDTDASEGATDTFQLSDASDYWEVGSASMLDVLQWGTLCCPAGSSALAIAGYSAASVSRNWQLTASLLVLWQVPIEGHGSPENPVPGPGGAVYSYAPSPMVNITPTIMTTVL